MDFVEAKANLDKIANIYKSAQFLADALDTAATLDRRGQELKNNVEHLEKVQVEKQAALDGLDAAQTTRMQALGAQYAARVQQLQDDFDQKRSRLSVQQAEQEATWAETQRQVGEAIAAGQAQVTTLDRQIDQQQQILADLESKIAAMRAQAQKVLA